MRQLVGCLALLALISGPAKAALLFDFDYRFDTQGYFDEQYRRDALEAAGRIVNRYVDELAELIPSEGRGMVALPNDPSSGGQVVLRDEPLAAGAMKIFVGARSLPGRLAQASAFEYSPEPGGVVGVLCPVHRHQVVFFSCKAFVLENTRTA